MTNEELRVLGDDLHAAISRLEKAYFIPKDNDDLLVVHGIDAELCNPSIIDELREL